MAVRHGGIRRLLDVEWAKVYKTTSPRGLVVRDALRRAA